MLDRRFLQTMTKEELIYIVFAGEEGEELLKRLKNFYNTHLPFTHKSKLEDYAINQGKLDLIEYIKRVMEKERKSGDIQIKFKKD